MNKQELESQILALVEKYNQALDKEDEEFYRVGLISVVLDEETYDYKTDEFSTAKSMKELMGGDNYVNRHFEVQMPGTKYSQDLQWIPSQRDC